MEENVRKPQYGKEPTNHFAKVPIWLKYFCLFLILMTFFQKFIVVIPDTYETVILWEQNIIIEIGLFSVVMRDIPWLEIVQYNV